MFFHLQSIKRKDDPQEVKVQMQFVVYGTRPSKDKSGAYLFLPDGKAKVFLVMSHTLRFHLKSFDGASHGYPLIFILLGSLGQNRLVAVSSLDLKTQV